MANDRKMEGAFSVTLLDQLIDAETDIEQEIDLETVFNNAGYKFEKGRLPNIDRAVLRIVATGETGSVDFDIDSLSLSYDGNNFHTHQSFSPLNITAAAYAAPIQVTVPFGPATKARIDVTNNGTLDGSNSITVDIKLEGVFREGDYV